MKILLAIIEFLNSIIAFFPRREDRLLEDAGSLKEKERAIEKFNEQNKKSSKARDLSASHYYADELQDDGYRRD